MRPSYVRSHTVARFGSVGDVDLLITQPGHSGSSCSWCVPRTVLFCPFYGVTPVRMKRDWRFVPETPNSGAESAIDPTTRVMRAT